MVRRPPEGTITLLFTDIEGSTKLLQRAGEAYSNLLAEHRRMLRAAFDEHDGYEVDTEGDAFFVAFHSANHAAAAAVAAQRALAQPSWPEGHEVRVRMGIHAGSPRLVDGAYIGLDVHRAARVMAAGYGGQILLSNAARRQLGDAWPVADLGEHRLKDLLQPERLFQLNVPGLRSEFPPVKTLGNRPTNLPAQPNALIGRRTELRDIIDALRGGHVRLLTLTGPGGTGKTRVALQAGADLLDEYRGGVFFVSLAPITQEELLLHTIARTLALQDVGGEELAETLKSYLADKQMLLILDNLEQIVGSAPAIADLLDAAPEISVLATSRERLKLAAEHVYDVPPLVRDEAIGLFVARAQAAAPDFALTEESLEAVDALCTRLEDLPLALELAAARTAVLSPTALLSRLERRLPMLTGGARDADERQRTLRATIEWSFELLDEFEQGLFRDLSVFVDGCRLDAVVAVSSRDELEILDGLQSLLDKSLLRRRTDSDGEQRFWMLETIREYADERAAEAEVLDLLSQRHAAHFLALAERAEPELWRQATDVWIPRFDAEQPNIRRALEWAFAQDDVKAAYRLAGALYPYWEMRGQHGEARMWLSRVLDRDGDVSPRLRAKALTALGRATAGFGDRPQMLALLEEAATISRQLGDLEGVGRCLGFIGHGYLFSGDHEGAAAALEEGVELARKVGDARSLQRAISNAAAAVLELREFDRARDMYAESAELARSEGLTVSAALSTALLGYTLTLAGDFAAAERELAAAAAAYADLGDSTWTQAAFRYRGMLLLLRGDVNQAELVLRDSLARGRDHSRIHELARWVEDLAAVADAKGESERAATLWGAADALLERAGEAILEEDRQVRARYRRETQDPDAWAVGQAMTLEEAIDFALS
jgi:predicted ATPase/class 3 adenylate cyclase